MSLEVTPFEISGPKLITLKTFRDDRGFFVERFNEAVFRELGFTQNFVQDNFSRSSYAVLRGLHYQFSPEQGKLVTCTRGEIFDVAVDLRMSSPTFGKYVSVNLSGDHPQVFWVPSGFAHGFCVTSKEGADVQYKVDNLYNAKGEACLAWNDADVNIQWPISSPILSPKDAVGGLLKDYKKSPRF